MPNWYTINHPKTCTHTIKPSDPQMKPPRELYLWLFCLLLQRFLYQATEIKLFSLEQKNEIGINPQISILAEKYFLRGVCFPSEALQTCNVRNYYYREMAGGSRGAFWQHVVVMGKVCWEEIFYLFKGLSINFVFTFFTVANIVEQLILQSG